MIERWGTVMVEKSEPVKHYQLNVTRNYGNVVFMLPNI